MHVQGGTSSNKSRRRAKNTLAKTVINKSLLPGIGTPVLFILRGFPNPSAILSPIRYQHPLGPFPPSLLRPPLLRNCFVASPTLPSASDLAPLRPPSPRDSVGSASAALAAISSLNTSPRPNWTFSLYHTRGNWSLLWDPTFLFPPWLFAHLVACGSAPRWLNMVERCMPPSLSRSIMGHAWAVRNPFRFASLNLYPRGGTSKWVCALGCHRIHQPESISIVGNVK